MALFTENLVRARARKEKSKTVYFNKSESVILLEESRAFNKSKVYDIFLSHSSKDAELILGIKGILEDLGYTVYVDWIDDPQLNRTDVTKSTANVLRERMSASKSLFYVTTDNAITSKWMPWECGYFDGFKEKVAITPIKKISSNDRYQGQEYLGIYPYTVKGNTKGGTPTLWIQKDSKTYLSYDDWVNTPNSELNWKND